MVVLQFNNDEIVQGNFREVLQQIRINLSFYYLISLEANGEELEKIKSLFFYGGSYTIPMTDEHEVKWFGDTAKTIIYSLINSR